MPEPSENSHRVENDSSERRGLRDSVQVFGSHDEARAHEIAQQAKRSPYERMKQFMELQQRIWGTDNPDVREAGTVNIERRDR